jgi:RNA polymerase sigma-70 factor (ECF subfamily)
MSRSRDEATLGELTPTTRRDIVTIAELHTDQSHLPTDADWTNFYRRNAPPLYRFLLKLTRGNRGKAEDHLQETFLRTWRWLLRNPANLDTLRPLLYTVARRIAIDDSRARQVRPCEVMLDELTPVPAGDDEFDRVIQGHAIRDALSTLRKEHQAALIELFYHERTAKEAATVLGIPEGTVKSRAHYGLRALKLATVAAEREPRSRRLQGTPAEPTEHQP